MPMYEKLHSYGEYIFDWGWADAYRRYGYAYYPKLLSAIPYSPVTGPRLLTTPEHSHSNELFDNSLRFIQSLLNDGYSSWHCLYPTQEESDMLQQLGLLQRTNSHFKWRNRNYRCFDDFLQQMKSRKRKQIGKEHARARELGITFEQRAGNDIREQDIETFYQFYQLTYLKRSGHGGYLPLEFFQSLLETMPEQLLLINAQRNERTIAAAFFFVGNNALYGRYWGCIEEHDLLHFETCYYQGIEFAIEQGLALFDPGTQGEHKVARGFEPVSVFSNHMIGNEDFAEAIANHIERENLYTRQYLAAMRERLPFKQIES